MPSKYQEYRQMADTAERQLTSSYKSWTQFLRTAARLYKYPYNEQVMIHAQRPDATACAEYDFWTWRPAWNIWAGALPPIWTSSLWW